MMRFAGKTALVTGALGGIGGAACRRLAAEGARLVLVDRPGLDAEPLLAALAGTDAAPALFLPADITDEAAVADVCARAVAETGRLDVIVNVAGQMIYKPLEDLTMDDWQRLFAVNLFGAAQFIRQGLRLMGPGGAIVNVASIHAHQTSPLVAPYAAAKAGLVSLTRSAAIEGKEKGIRVNAVLPGAVETQMLRDSPNIKSGAETIDPADIGTPEEVASAIAFLAAEEASFITGSALVVDGGRLTKL